MNSFDVVGYTFEADMYCVSCTQKRFGRGYDTAIDREGNEVHPIFAGSEVEGPEDECCGACGDVILEAEQEDTDDE